MNCVFGVWCVFVCLEIEVFVCELVFGCVCVCVVCVFCDCSLGLYLFGFVVSATRPGNCAYHEFWIPGSLGGHDS